MGQTISITPGFGSVSYGLPAPAGHWIASPFLCEAVAATGDRACDWEQISDMVGMMIYKFEATVYNADFPPECRSPPGIEP